MYDCEALNGMCPLPATFEIRRTDDEERKTDSSYLCDVHADEEVYNTPESDTIPLVRWQSQMSAIVDELKEMAGVR